MKRKLALLLTLLCLMTAVLPACKSGGEKISSEPENSEPASAQPAEVPTINIFMDFARSSSSSSNVTNLLQNIPGYGTEFYAMTETLMADSQDREAVLTRVKTEIMAGKGPDVFICENPIVETDDYGGALFPFPQKAMKNHLLLPLDEYIENAEFMEWDKLLPVVMEAGRNEEGQQILPMGFSFEVIAYNKELFTLKDKLPVTWDEAIASDDPLVRYAATWGENRDIFGNIADLDKDVMTITEEELTARFQQAWNLEQEAKEGAFPEFTELNEKFGYLMSDDESKLKWLIMSSNTFLSSYSSYLGGEADYWLVPRYNTEGGITVNVELFGAVNRNTKLPKESFRVLDKLLSYEGQNSEFAKWVVGMPVHMDVGFDGKTGLGWSMNEWNAGQYKSLLGQINSVRYSTPVEQELFEIYPDYYNNGGEWADIVHKHYMKMQMMLAES